MSTDHKWALPASKCAPAPPGAARGASTHAPEPCLGGWSCTLVCPYLQESGQGQGGPAFLSHYSDKLCLAPAGTCCGPKGCAQVSRRMRRSPRVQIEPGSSQLLRMAALLRRHLQRLPSSQRLRPTGRPPGLPEKGQHCLLSAACQCSMPVHGGPSASNPCFWARRSVHPVACDGHWPPGSLDVQV